MPNSKRLVPCPAPSVHVVSVCMESVAAMQQRTRLTKWWLRGAMPTAAVCLGDINGGLSLAAHHSRVRSLQPLWLAFWMLPDGMPTVHAQSLCSDTCTVHMLDVNEAYRLSNASGASAHTICRHDCVASSKHLLVILGCCTAAASTSCSVSAAAIVNMAPLWR